jgi:hypothetical protein
MGCCGWRASDRPATPASSGPTDAADDTVTRHRAVADQVLMAASGGKSLCRAGGSDHAVKHAEGRMAAIAEVQRRHRSTGEDPAAAGRVILERWRADEDAARGRGGAWMAYRRGGIEALEALIGDLAAPAPGRCRSITR